MAVVNPRAYGAQSHLAPTTLDSHAMALDVPAAR